MLNLWPSLLLVQVSEGISFALPPPPPPPPPPNHRASSKSVDSSLPVFYHGVVPDGQESWSACPLWQQHLKSIVSRQYLVIKFADDKQEVLT